MNHPQYVVGSGKSPFPSDKSSTGIVKVLLKIASNESRVTMETDESYQLKIVANPQGHEVEIEAETYFGARHGLETLSQLISYDELRNSLQMHSEAAVEDKPSYVHRGLLIDTSRNFFGLDILKRIIDGLSYNKMNVFHWHITDTHSFPLKLKSVPELAQFGAYSAGKHTAAIYLQSAFKMDSIFLLFLLYSAPRKVETSRL